MALQPGLCWTCSETYTVGLLMRKLIYNGQNMKPVGWLVDLGFNIPPTVKVTLRRDFGYIVSSEND